ncbi:MAG TPA: glycosyltransferase family 4 protein [Candidatus Limnocylindria bacterium]|nr:glycosyltransferase family 4 protein [Candidatus Limnocylindria bacterium]
MSDRLRIAFVYDALFPYVHGGAERRNHELARRLAARHEVHIVTWSWWDGAPDTSLDGITLHGVGKPPGLYGSDGKRTVREALAFSARVFPVLLRGRWDVIDCAATPYLPLWSTWLATRLTGTRLAVTWHEFWGDHWLRYLPDRPAIARAARALESASRWIGDDVVAVSAFTGRALGRGSEAVRVVPNGIDLDLIDAAPQPPGPADIVYLGRLIDEKRVDLLLEAVGMLRDRLPQLRAGIIGSGPELPSLTARAERLGLAERVTFHGPLDSPTAFGHLRAARLLVMPSIREGFGMAVAEAQAAGTVPIVVRSRTSAAPELVRDGVDGFITDPTPAALASAIERALADPRRLSQMAGAARAVGAERDWDRLALRMEAIYGASPSATPLPAMESAR